MKYRHGDLSLHITRDSLKELKKIGKSGFVLAEGETTGHKHVITAKKGSVNIYKGKNGEMVISVKGRAVITHEEHKTIEVKTGKYLLRNEREKDWFSLSVRRVID